MPRLQSKVEAFFGKKASRWIDPDESVAAGAAIEAARQSASLGSSVKTTEPSARPGPALELTDVVPISIGVELDGGVFSAVVRRNTPLPARVTKVFTTAADGQEFVNVRVFQGDRPLTRDNRALATLRLDGLPPVPAGQPEIEVGFIVDDNGVLNVDATDLRSGQRQRMRVDTATGLSPEQISGYAAQAESLNESAAMDDAWRKAKAAAEATLHGATGAAQGLAAHLPAETAARLNLQIQSCRQALTDKELRGLTEATSALDATLKQVFSLVAAAG